MCAAMIGTPAFMRAGAPRVATMMYAGAVGTPMPRMMQVTISMAMSSKRLLPASAVMTLMNL